jgi:hypothetical protein
MPFALSAISRKLLPRRKLDYYPGDYHPPQRDNAEVDDSPIQTWAEVRVHMNTDKESGLGPLVGTWRLISEVATFSDTRGLDDIKCGRPHHVLVWSRQSPAGQE